MTTRHGGLSVRMRAHRPRAGAYAWASCVVLLLTWAAHALWCRGAGEAQRVALLLTGDTKGYLEGCG